MYKRCFPLALLILMLPVFILGCQTDETQKKPAPENKAPAYKTLISAAEADPYENGCVSCHKKTEEVDRTLPAYVDKIPGHPEVKETTVNACYKCHEAEKNFSLYQKFYQGMHRAHWKSETFYTKLNGRCSSCHTVESNGVSGIKEYPPAGYRTGLTEKKTTPQGNQPAPQKKPLPEQTGEPDEREQPGQQEPPGQQEQPAQEEETKDNRPGQDEIPAPTP
ncbi:MAG: hypothetical protein CVU89_12335 [Firmicutes bacterium HGW-Firmicutes-14]|nr:MAG: hypothetical protein CVU89_12335 [Firmicutes bacterium HGW-Firmicutes-14]